MTSSISTTRPNASSPGSRTNSPGGGPSSTPSSPGSPTSGNPSRIPDRKPADTTAPDPGPAGRRVTRRGLLTAAVAGGAGLIATQVADAAPAAAAPGNNLVLGTTNSGGNSVTTLSATPGQNSSPFGVLNTNPTGDSIGIYSQLGTRSGLFDGTDLTRAAVIGDSDDGVGVTGLSGTTGVYGKSSADNGVGVRGTCDSGTGVTGNTTSGTGVVGLATEGTGVSGLTFGTGPGVQGVSSHGTGVYGVGGDNGFGVVAESTRSPFRIVPSTTTTGAPTTDLHVAGELFVDKAGKLFYCVKAGTPGTWKKVSMS